MREDAKGGFAELCGQYFTFRITQDKTSNRVALVDLYGGVCVSTNKRIK